ncbi:MAG TPA: YibE/F family protein [Streptomyces sp.]|nr:YibE/F family protein [Streptomyces sp.]
MTPSPPFRSDRQTPGPANPGRVPGQGPEQEQHHEAHEPGNAHRNAHGDAQAHAHTHAHSHGPPAPVSRHLRKIIAAVVIPFAAAVIAGLVVLWPGGVPGHEEESGVGFDRPTFPARVTAVVQVDCKDVNVQQPSGQPGQSSGAAQGAGGKAGGICRKATVEVTGGKDKGDKFTEVVPPDATRTYSTGQEVVVAYAENAPRELRYSVIDVDRDVPTVLLAGVFALFVVLVGRMRGLLALAGLAVSFAVLSFFILPAILQGSNPLVVAVVGGSAIMLATLYLCHGLSARTSVAVVGTLISLLLIGVLGSLFIDWARLTGNTDDQTSLVHGLFPDIGIQGLLLAGVLIGSLGVLDDVTVTQTSAVWELKAADPGAGWRKLYGAAMRIGRDHIASVVNTLVLAYAGAALPLMLLFSIAHSSVPTVATSEVVAEEIVRTLVGSIGLVASVPVTTLLAALVVSADRRRTVASGVTGGMSATGGTGRTDGVPAADGAHTSQDAGAGAPAPVTSRRGGKRRKPK